MVTLLITGCGGGSSTATTLEDNPQIARIAVTSELSGDQDIWSLNLAGWNPNCLAEYQS